MKKLIVLVLMIIPFLLNAQKGNINIPQAVLNTFKQKVLDSVTVKWEKKKEYYEANFTKNNLKAEVEIKEDGQWIKTSWEIPVEYIPSKIKTNINTAFPGYKIKEAEIEYKQDGDAYVVEVKKKKELIDLYYKINGDFIKSEKDTD